ncbi:NAD(P)/FAD-dependent oxidoreductase [Saccharopolyspora mangrovi]|uniref:FAD-dependent oxidoreductase n=1 Tax=Saccharopolyspora mangrovi TaxID=3082379 RepID=A0ABU6AGC8_9PSEU|nr:FAD-dependent oxidoreductase [Saccharopolyspora sp. S2-29]MEB3370533.1 FAD-dependent oxidoreductase [Saccharopolyspora sp. S2-29]
MPDIGTLDTADIAVVGGGVVGLTTALQLRKRGFDVVVVEQRFTAYGASGRSAGAIWLQPRRSGPELQLARRGLASYSAYEEELGNTFDLRRQGGLFFYETERQAEVLEHYAADRRAAGLEATLVSRREARELSEVLPDSALGAVFCSDDAQVDAGAFARAVGAACMRRGVRIFENTPVLGTLRRVDTVAGVRTVRGEVHAGAVVWATGAWSVTLRSEGIDLPIETHRVGQLVTQPVASARGPVIHGPRGVDRCGALTDLEQFDPADFEIDAADDALVYDDVMTQNTEGSLVIGHTFDGRGSLNPHISMIATRAMIESTVARTQRFAALGVTGLWAGLVGETADRLPIVDSIDGLFVNVGHSSGIADGPATSEILARRVIGESDPLAAQLAVDRAGLRPSAATPDGRDGSSNRDVSTAST